MIRLIDDFGREICLNVPATRIVSLVPSLTEVIHAFGAGDRLVGVTRHCTQPATGLESAARIGGTKNPDVDEISRLRPDLVVVNAEENRREDFENLVRAGMNVLVTHPRRVRDVPGLLRLIGHAVGAEPRGSAAAGRLERELAAWARPPSGRTVFCPIWKNPWMTFNGDTFADDLLVLCGGDNPFRARQARYFEISLEEVAATQPEIILLPDEPYVFRSKDLGSLAALTQTPAMRDGRVHFVDGKALFWFGTRTVGALRYVHALLERAG